MSVQELGQQASPTGDAGWAHVNIYCSKMKALQRVPWWARPGEDLLGAVFVLVQVSGS